MSDNEVIPTLETWEHEHQDMAISRYERGRNKRRGFLVHMEGVEVLDLDTDEATALRDLLNAALSPDEPIDAEIDDETDPA